ncbi:MAG: hypothetical protein QNK37_18995 [Acidobacteriota bacterium]|nr:hypothetical protein [Acidobacteriota bacterium]
MEPLETAVAITAIVLGYKLLSQLITRVKAPSEHKSFRMSRKKPVEPPPIPELYDPPEVLLARAEEMQRRIDTLEEIIAAERLQRSES